MRTFLGSHHSIAEVDTCSSASQTVNKRSDITHSTLLSSERSSAEMDITELPSIKLAGGGYGFITGE